MCEVSAQAQSGGGMASERGGTYREVGLKVLNLLRCLGSQEHIGDEVVLPRYFGNESNLQ